MTKDEALKLALEVLENGKRVRAFEGGTKFQEPLEDAAITAIKAALVTKDVSLPEQEPVAWRNAAIRVGEDLCSVGPFGYYDMTAEQWLDWALSVVTVHASPPQRQPLTDVEVDEIVDEHTSDDGQGYDIWCDGRGVARAIEAKHGIGDKT